MGVLSLIVADSVTTARLTNAVGKAFRVVSHDGWRDFQSSLEAVMPAAVIVDIDHPSGPDSVGHLMNASRAGGFGVVVCSSFEGRELALYELGVAGVGGFILSSEAANRAVVRSNIERAVSLSVAERLAADLPAWIPPLGRTALRWSVQHATESPSVAKLAVEVGHSAGSLRKTLLRRGLPSPKRTLMWGRLFFAARELARSTPSVESLAHRLGYASRSGLTRMMKRELGAPPRVLRGRDVWQRAVSTYLAELKSA